VCVHVCVHAKVVFVVLSILCNPYTYTQLHFFFYVYPLPLSHTHTRTHMHTTFLLTAMLLASVQDGLSRARREDEGAVKRSTTAKDLLAGTPMPRPTSHWRQRLYDMVNRYAFVCMCD
jgi:hypothetical protein